MNIFIQCYLIILYQIVVANNEYSTFPIIELIPGIEERLSFIVEKNYLFRIYEKNLNKKDLYKLRATILGNQQLNFDMIYNCGQKRQLDAFDSRYLYGTPEYKQIDVACKYEDEYGVYYEILGKFEIQCRKDHEIYIQTVDALVSVQKKAQFSQFSNDRYEKFELFWIILLFLSMYYGLQKKFFGNFDDQLNDNFIGFDELDQNSDYMNKKNNQSKNYKNIENLNKKIY